MFEIKIKRKLSVWPFMLIGLIVLAFMVYMWNKKKKDGLTEKPKGVSESTLKQSPGMMVSIDKALFFYAI